MLTTQSFVRVFLLIRFVFEKLTIVIEMISVEEHAPLGDGTPDNRPPVLKRYAGSKTIYPGARTECVTKSTKVLIGSILVHEV